MMPTNRSVIRMTASAAQKILATAERITDITELTEQHLDVIQMQDIGLNDRASLCYASDAIAMRMYDAPSVIAMMALWNKLVDRAARA